ncbi:MAG: SsrA-binding protein [Parcubacteria bacterium C7867-001]|nr:MAG: SsrA-binding protein [Parcubacteria bacterium C7867-001]
MSKPLIEYKKARIKFETLETLSAGIELSGAETKALRNGMGTLDGSRVIVRGGEAYVVGMSIPPYQPSNTPKEYEPERPRRLLLKKGEIAQLSEAEAKKGLTVVPIEVYNNRYLKVRIAIVRGKGKADRREDLKRRDYEREVARLLKN